MPALDIRHFRRHRYEIVGHVAVEHLSALVIKAMFEQRCAYALNHAAPDLLIHELRVDDCSAVFHAPMFQQFHETGVGIDLEITCLDAVGESKWPCARYIVARCYQLSLEAGR